jgi:hypothetical protein
MWNSHAPVRLIETSENFSILENFSVALGKLIEALENFFVALENFLASADTHLKNFSA